MFGKWYGLLVTRGPKGRISPKRIYLVSPLLLINDENMVWQTALWAVMTTSAFK